MGEKGRKRERVGEGEREEKGRERERVEEGEEVKKERRRKREENEGKMREQVSLKSQFIKGIKGSVLTKISGGGLVMAGST